MILPLGFTEHNGYTYIHTLSTNILTFCPWQKKCLIYINSVLKLYKVVNF